MISKMFLICMQCVGSALKTSAPVSFQATRGQQPGGQERVKLDHYNLGASRADGLLNVEAAAQSRDI